MPKVHFLYELYTDIKQCTLAWEWILVVDGAERTPIPKKLKNDGRIVECRVGRQVGTAASRNMGLGISRGEFVTACDDDDRLPARSFEVRLDALRSAHVDWVAGLLADLRGQEQIVWNCPAPRGYIRAGELWKSWISPEATYPLGPSTLLMRTALLRQVGGWQGLPQAEDLGMVMAVSGVAAGVVLDEVVYLYRRHDGQMMNQPDFDSIEPLVREITFERGRLLCELLAPRGQSN
ncbi:MAG: glycosyltransferase [Candidatus Dormibacteria bacterium]